MSQPKKRAEPLIINDFGMLYRFSRRNWKRYCLAYVEKQGAVRLYDYGARYIGQVLRNITDWKVEDFREHLEME